MQRINVVATYLKQHNLELMGVKTGNDCLCNAVLKSYKTLSRKIPILDAQKDKISYLKNLIELENKKKQEYWFDTIFHKLARILSIPIRLITVNQDHFGITDELFEEREQYPRDWRTIYKKPKECISIVNLGGHFVFARSFSEKTIEAPSGSLSRRNDIKRCVRDYMKQKIAQLMCKLFEQLTVSEKLDKMMAFDILPMIQVMTIESLVRQIFKKNRKDYVTYFESRNQEELVRKLKGEVRGSLKQSSSQGYDKIVEICIEQLIGEVNESINNYREKPENLKRKNATHILAAINKHFDIIYHDNNSLYGDLIINIIFRIGKFTLLNSADLGEMAAEFIKNDLSKEVTAAMYQIQKSPHYLIDKVIKKIQTDYLDRGAVKSLLFENQEKITPEKIQQKLKEEINKTAQVTHDLITYMLDNCLFKNIIIGEDSTKLNNVITNMWQKVFKNQYRMQNLVIKAYEEISEALEQALKMT